MLQNQMVLGRQRPQGGGRAPPQCPFSGADLWLRAAVGEKCVLARRFRVRGAFSLATGSEKSHKSCERTSDGVARGSRWQISFVGLMTECIERDDQWQRLMLSMKRPCTGLGSPHPWGAPGEAFPC